MIEGRQEEDRNSGHVIRLKRRLFRESEDNWMD